MFFCEFLAQLLRAIVLFIIFGQFRLKRCIGTIFGLKLKNFQKTMVHMVPDFMECPLNIMEIGNSKLYFFQNQTFLAYIQQEQTPKCLVPTMTAAGNHARKISFNIKTHNNLSCLVDQNQHRTQCSKKIFARNQCNFGT